MQCTGCAEFVGEACNLGPRTLFFRRRRQDPDGSSGTVVDPTSTMVDSVPETHLMTDSDGSESGASSGFLNMFARDLDVGGQAPILHDSQEDMGEEHTGDDSVTAATGHPNLKTVRQHVNRKRFMKLPLLQFRLGPNF